jgi:hypothetical protein
VPPSSRAAPSASAHRHRLGLAAGPTPGWRAVPSASARRLTWQARTAQTAEPALASRQRWAHPQALPPEPEPRREPQAVSPEPLAQVAQPPEPQAQPPERLARPPEPQAQLPERLARPPERRA